MKQASLLSLFGNSARWPWLWLLLFPGGGPVLGQAIPEPGIYRVDRMADYRPTDEFYYGIRTYAAPRHSPLVAATGARYCLVAVDSSTDEHKTRLVFLPPRPLAADVARAFVGGFSSPLDSMMSVSYPWEDPHDKWAGRWPGNARFRGRSFVLYENELTKDSGAGNPPRPYRANDPGRFLTVAPRGSLLVLDQPRPYRDLLAVRPAKLFFYAAPDTARRTEAYVVAGQYVAILRETAHWYLAEYVTPAGQRRQGWLSKLEQLTWVPQQAQTPAYRFEAAYVDTAAATSYSDIRPYPLVLKVIERRTGRLVQLLDLDVEEGWDACDNAVRIPDCNFDGHPDLELYAHSGGAGPNIGHVFYLFDPATEQFVFHEGLSDLTQTQVDPATKTISAGWRNGCCHHGSEAYRFLNGQFTLVARHEDDCLGADGYCYVTDGRLVRGKWREKRRKYKLDLVYPEDQGARTSRKKGA